MSIFVLQSFVIGGKVFELLSRVQYFFSCLRKKCLLSTFKANIGYFCISDLKVLTQNFLVKITLAHIQVLRKYFSCKGWMRQVLVQYYTLIKCNKKLLN